MDSVGIRRSRMYTRPPEFSSFGVKESPPMNLETPSNRIFPITIMCLLEERLRTMSYMVRLLIKICDNRKHATKT
jgi:hypothetical protein